MKGKKHMPLVRHDIMLEGMVFCIKAFAIACVTMSLIYFAIGETDQILRFFSL